MLARASMKKLTFLRASTQHVTVCSQAEIIPTFLAGEKDITEAESASSEDGITRIGTWGTHHHKSKYWQLQQRHSLCARRASSGREGCYAEAPDKGGPKKCRLLCLSVTSHALKAVSRYEIHTGEKTYGKLSNEKWRKSSSAARFTPLLTVLACSAVVEVGPPQRSSSSSCSQQEVRWWGPPSLYENLA